MSQQRPSRPLFSGTEPCRCPCHEHPGTYPTSEQRPCSICGHVNAHGEFLGYRQGWRSTRSVAPDQTEKKR